MNEVTKEGYSAIEQALRDEAIPPRVEPKKFERRDTVVMPIPDSAAERIAHSRRVDHGVSHMDAMLESKNAIHGDFTGNATTAQALKYVMRQGKNWEEMPAWMRESARADADQGGAHPLWRLHAS